MCIVIGLSFHFCFQLQQSGFYQIISGTKRRSHKQSWKKWKHSDSSNSNSVELMTLLTTPIFYFHKVISALMTPLTIPTPTPLLLKTSLWQREPRPHTLKTILLLNKASSPVGGHNFVISLSQDWQNCFYPKGEFHISMEISQREFQNLASRLPTKSCFSVGKSH